MRVLVVCAESPLPTTSGAALRTWGWIRTIQHLVHVRVATLAHTREELDALHQTAASGFEIESVSSPRTWARKTRDVLRMLRWGLPYRLWSGEEQPLHAKFRQILDEFRPDIVQAEQLAAAPYLQAAQRRGIATIFSTHNVECRMGARGPRPTSWWVKKVSTRNLPRAEMKWAAECKAVVAVSQDEAEWFGRVAKKVVVVPNALHLDDYSNSPPFGTRRNTILFVGHFGYRPNHDAAVRLARHIFPIIQQHIPETRCILAGRKPSFTIQNLSRIHGVEVVGDFDDGQSPWESATVFLSPLRQGTGSRLKLLEAAARGIPIVATPLSAEGLALIEGRDYSAAFTDREMATATIELLSNPNRRQILARSAHRTVTHAHAWPIWRPTIMALYEDLAHHDRKK